VRCREMVEAGGVGIFWPLKTRKLLILLDAKDAQNHEIAPNWNVSGTRRLSRIVYCAGGYLQYNATVQLLVL
jgi:hypothetical protein